MKQYMLWAEDCPYKLLYNTVEEAKQQQYVENFNFGRKYDFQVSEVELLVDMLAKNADNIDYRDWDYQDLQDKDPELVEQPAHTEYITGIDGPPLEQPAEQPRCLSNCGTCDHKARPDGGWCYMFRNEPQGVCTKHTPMPAHQQVEWDGLNLRPKTPKEYVGLTDEEIKNIWGSYFSRGIEFARAIESKLKEKNT